MFSPSSCMEGFENYLAQMIIKTRHCALYKNHVATSKVKFTVRTYCLCIGLTETYSSIHVWLITLLLGLPQGWCDIRIWFSILRSHQGSILLKALGGGNSVLWTHLFPSHISHARVVGTKVYSVGFALISKMTTRDDNSEPKNRYF